MSLCFSDLDCAVIAFIYFALSFVLCFLLSRPFPGLLVWKRVETRSSAGGHR